METVETTPRTGIVQERRMIAQGMGEVTDSVEMTRENVQMRLGAALIDKLDDGRAYEVAVKWIEEERSLAKFENPPPFLDARSYDGLLICLRATILLRHWQDAQIGEDVVGDVFSSTLGAFCDEWWVEVPVGVTGPMAETIIDGNSKPPPYYDTISIETERRTFQRITAEGRTLCWRRVA